MKKRKIQYLIRNRKQYNAALVQRGSLALWIEPSVLDNWLHPKKTGQRGASCAYSDAVIELALTMKAVYGLPLRATVGLLESVLKMLGLEHLPVSDYSTLSRHQKSLKVSLKKTRSIGQTLHLVIDSISCTVYGEGEWKVRQHGISKQRPRHKLHLGVDEATGVEAIGLIEAACLTTNDVADSTVPRVVGAD